MAKRKTTKTVEPTIIASCESGCTRADLEAMFNPSELIALDEWMYGQTMMLCTGQKYNHETKEYEIACGGVAHGPIVYVRDVERFMHNLPVVD